MKPTLLAYPILSLLLASLHLNAQRTEIRYLSGTDKDNTVTWDFFCTKGMNSGQWATIQVPSQWEQQGYGAYNYGHDKVHHDEQGFYKYRFTVPTHWKNKRVHIVFEGVMTDTDVKINGISAGPVHQGGFYQFRYDISELLNYKATNLLEVNVSKESANESINRAERIADYWIFGGIYRPVYLEALPETFIERVAIDAKDDGSFHLDVFTDISGKDISVEAHIQTLDGTAVGDRMQSNKKENDERYTLGGKVPQPALWNPESPNLYQVIVQLKKGKKTLHETTQKFGFRTVELRPADGIYVNGTKTMFRGVCRHTFWPESGRTSSKALAIEVVNLIKDMNMNAVRMSHYPPDQYFLDVCDSLGLFVIDELAGWQKKYDTPTARRLVKSVVTRDVNHPCVVIWANGNEGGFNTDVRSDYSLYDPQNRTVIEPWSKVNGTDTKHYPRYSYVRDALTKGDLIYFPTEFLHGLFDGGHGAGLDDYWNLMTSSPLSAGGFLWVFADEGIERRDKNDSIDTSGNYAPDGILGPYHQKEGSFYTIKEIWSPVQFLPADFPAGFNGEFNVENRFLYTNLHECAFSYELVKWEQPLSAKSVATKTGTILSPRIAPGEKGKLVVNLPADWRKYDALYITASDNYNRQINTWSWNITTPQAMAGRVVPTKNNKTRVTETDSVLTLTSGETSVTFNKNNGLITNVSHHTEKISFGNGPRFAGFETSFKELKHKETPEGYVVELLYDSIGHIRCTMLENGWMQLDYQYSPEGACHFTGITFSYPENKVQRATLMANGPYHVWKNRLKGTRFGVYEKEYNNTITGESWDYPEFKGYYSNFYAVQIHTDELPVTVVSATEGLFLHLFTPQKAKYSNQNVNPAFPAGDISVLNSISPIGTKFSRAEEEGPQGQKNICDGRLFSGRVYLKFGQHIPHK